MLFGSHYEYACAHLFKPTLVLLSKRALLRVRWGEDVGFVPDAFAAWTKNGVRAKNQALLYVLMHDFHRLLLDGANVDYRLAFTHERRDFLDDIFERADGHAYHDVVGVLDGFREVSGFNAKLLAQAHQFLLFPVCENYLFAVILAEFHHPYAHFSRAENGSLHH